MELQSQRFADRWGFIGTQWLMTTTIGLIIGLQWNIVGLITHRIFDGILWNILGILWEYDGRIMEYEGTTNGKIYR